MQCSTTHSNFKLRFPDKLCWMLLLSHMVEVGQFIAHSVYSLTLLFKHEVCSPSIAVVPDGTASSLGMMKRRSTALLVGTFRE